MLRFVSLCLLSVCLLALLLIGPSCNQKKVSSKVSVDQAEKLVADWVKAHKDKCYWHDNPELKDVTTKEIQERLYAQVFKLKDFTQSIPEIDAYLIKNKKVYPMSVGFGGCGLMETCVFDIDHDSKDELLYVYSWGSGIHRSIIEAYRFTDKYPTKISANFAVSGANVSLVKQIGRRIEIYVTRDVHGGENANMRLGELVFQNNALDVKLDANLPKKWENSIWRLGNHKPSTK